MRVLALEMARMLENGIPHSEKALAQVGKELRRLFDENAELKKEKQSILQDYDTAAQVLHGGKYEDVSMLKPLANKATKVMEELQETKQKLATYDLAKRNRNSWEYKFTREG